MQRYKNFEKLAPHRTRTAKSPKPHTAPVPIKSEKYQVSHQLAPTGSVRGSLNGPNYIFTFESRCE